VKYRTILFDLDGTLLNTTDLIVASFLHTLDRHCPGQYEEQDVLSCLGEPLRDQMIRFGGEERADEMVRTYREHNIAHHDQYVKTFPGVNKVIQTLHDAGLSLGVVSNKSRVTVEMGLKLCRLEPWFSTVVCVEDAEKPKPDPAPIRLALNRLQAEEKTALMVGDSKYDLIAAAEAGVDSAGVAWATHGKESLLSYHPTVILETMESLYEVVGLEKAAEGGPS